MSVVEYLVIWGVILLPIYIAHRWTRAIKKEMQSYIDDVLDMIIRTSSVNTLINILANGISKNPSISVKCLKELKDRGISHDNIIKMVAQAKRIAKEYPASKKDI